MRIARTVVAIGGVTSHMNVDVICGICHKIDSIFSVCARAKTTRLGFFWLKYTVNLKQVPVMIGNLSVAIKLSNKVVVTVNGRSYSQSFTQAHSCIKANATITLSLNGTQNEMA